MKLSDVPDEAAFDIWRGKLVQRLTPGHWGMARVDEAGVLHLLVDGAEDHEALAAKVSEALLEVENDVTGHLEMERAAAQALRDLTDAYIHEIQELKTLPTWVRSVEPDTARQVGREEGLLVILEDGSHEFAVQVADLLREHPVIENCGVWVGGGELSVRPRLAPASILAALNSVDAEVSAVLRGRRSEAEQSEATASRLKSLYGGLVKPADGRTDG